jgi:iron complex transport system substrate-binding protein
MRINIIHIRKEKGEKTMFAGTKAPLAILLMLMMIVAAGCGNNAAPTSEGDASGNQTSSPAASAEPSPESITVKHAMGETVITGKPKVIVSLYQSANDVTVAFGLKPAGIVESWSEKPIYEYLRASLEGATMLGTEDQPNLEEISKLKPDIIFATKLRHEKIYDQLSQIAPTVVTEEVYDWKDTVRVVGEAMGMQEKADELMQVWTTRTEEFKARMGDKLPMEMAITNFRADHARVYYKSFAGMNLADLGFVEPESHNTGEWGVQLTSKESIPDMNADVIFNFNSGDDEAAIEKFYKEWTEHPLWKSLDAVKNNQVYQVEPVAWNFASGYLSSLSMLDDLNRLFP